VDALSDDDGGTEIDVAEEKAENDAGLPHTVPTADGKNRKPISRFPLCWPSTAHSLDITCSHNLRFKLVWVSLVFYYYVSALK
jgi:hypothetical protein